MADIKLNFSSQWPTVQVAKVIGSPATAGEADTYPYLRKIPHGLGYPPLAIGFGAPGFGTMDGVDVDSTYVYLSNTDYTHVVVYAVDISEPFTYPHYTSSVGDVLQDTSGGSLDLRKFLLHSRAVGPMVLTVSVGSYTNQSQDTLTLTYTHPLNYPIFNFGYVRLATTEGTLRAGVWKSAPLADQAWPVTQTDGYTTTLSSTITNGQYNNSIWVQGTGQVAADKGSIITMRNPAIITNNTTTVTL